MEKFQIVTSGNVREDYGYYPPNWVGLERNLVLVLTSHQVKQARSCPFSKGKSKLSVLLPEARYVREDVTILNFVSIFTSLKLNTHYTMDLMT